MKRLRLVLLILIIPLVTVGQYKNVGYTTSYGGGETTGGDYKSSFIAGEAGVSAQIARGGDKSVYPGLIPGGFIILSYGLKKDSVVLAAIYQSTNGDGWKDKTGWLSASDVSSWFGVTVTDQRVTGLDLSSNNLQKNLPQMVNTLSKLERVNLSDNELRKIPDLSGLPALTSLNISHNRLGFDDLIANKAMGGAYSYAPQKRYGHTQNDTVTAGGSYFTKDHIPGIDNQFQWIFDGFDPGQDSVAVAEATGEALTIPGVGYDHMGSYRLVATNPNLPDVKIQTRNHNLWATTTVKGSVYTGNQGALVDDGLVEVYRVLDGPYTLADSSVISEVGEYVIDDLVLGDFILKARANPQTWPDVIQTYYSSTIDWQDADTLEVRGSIDNVDIDMAFKPVVDPDPIGASITGTIETDLPEDSPENEEGRGATIRKVKDVGCSIRRKLANGDSGKEEEYELFDYIETDSDGKFDFHGIPEGEYLLNIQYPGVPMDSTSNVKFVIGGDVQEQKFEARALITESGISVQAYEVLSVPRPYLKGVILYPNPTEDVLKVDFYVNRKISSLKFEVVSVNGLKVSEKELDHGMGVQRTEVDLTKYESGIYFLVFTDAAGTFRHQVKIGKK